MFVLCVVAADGVNDDDFVELGVGGGLEVECGMWDGDRSSAKERKEGG